MGCILFVNSMIVSSTYLSLKVGTRIIRAFSSGYLRFLSVGVVFHLLFSYVDFEKMEITCNVGHCKNARYDHFELCQCNQFRISEKK